MTERTTLVIVIVCATIAALLLLLFAAKLLRARLSRRPREPLPPIQPLAHHRVSKYDTLDSRPPSSIPDPIPTHSFNSLESALPPSPPRRPLSNASLSSASRSPSHHNLRGLPHAPHSNLQIILPAPLSRPLSLRRDTDSDRTSFVDKWVPVGRDDSTSARRAPSSTSMSTSPSSYSYYHQPSPTPPLPQIPTDKTIS